MRLVADAKQRLLRNICLELYYLHKFRVANKESEPQLTYLVYLLLHVSTIFERLKYITAIATVALEAAVDYAYRLGINHILVTVFCMCLHQFECHNSTIDNFLFLSDMIDTEGKEVAKE
jgi:hypothetical protein